MAVVVVVMEVPGEGNYTGKSRNTCLCNRRINNLLVQNNTLSLNFMSHICQTMTHYYY